VIGAIGGIAALSLGLALMIVGGAAPVGKVIPPSGDDEQPVGNTPKTSETMKVPCDSWNTVLKDPILGNEREAGFGACELGPDRTRKVCHHRPMDR